MTTAELSPIPRHPGQFACIDLINSAFAHHLGKEPGFDRLPLREWQAPQGVRINEPWKVMQNRAIDGQLITVRNL